MDRRIGREHKSRIIVGAVLVVLGTFLPLYLDAFGFSFFGIVITAIGSIALLIGVIGAGVQAGNRELLEELRRTRPEARELTRT